MENRRGFSFVRAIPTKRLLLDEAILPPYSDPASADASGVSASSVSNTKTASPSAGENSQSPGRRRQLRRSRS
jgi:hypothetical protein